MTAQQQSLLFIPYTQVTRFTEQFIINYNLNAIYVMFALLETRFVPFSLPLASYKQAKEPASACPSPRSWWSATVAVSGARLLSAVAVNSISPCPWRSVCRISSPRTPQGFVDHPEFSLTRSMQDQSNEACMSSLRPEA